MPPGASISSTRPDVPPGNDFIAITAGNYHSLALKADGSIVAWGRNWNNQATSPDGNDFTAIAGGGYHNIALKSDGAIFAWGQDNHDLLEPPPGNDFTAIAAGELHDLALIQLCRYLLAGDLDNNCTVNLADVAKMASNWLVDCSVQARRFGVLL